VNLANGTGSCAVSNAVVGTYTATASYSGDGNYNAKTGTGSLAVAKGNPHMNVTGSATGSTLTFTATVSAPASGLPTPTGTIGWTISVNGNATCAPNPGTLQGAGGTASVSCTVSNADSKKTYTATANYSGDTSYTSTTAQSPGTAG
jgi:large repetitive protein